MKKVAGLFILSVFISTAVMAQETIQGMYAYTYGDSESLVDAKQTCKNLALRDALESYYLFVESTTEVENYQLKEDLIESISLGSMRQVKIVHESVEGRLISMTVTATVNPEEIQTLIDEKLKQSQSHETPPPEPHQPESLLTALQQYETRFGAMEQNAVQYNPEKIITTLQAVNQYLIQHRPQTNDAFSQTLYACVLTRNQLMSDMAKFKLYRDQGNRRQMLNQGKVIKTLSGRLKKGVKRLKGFDNLSTQKRTVQGLWVMRCEKILTVKSRSEKSIEQKSKRRRFN